MIYTFPFHFTSIKSRIFVTVILIIFSVSIFSQPKGKVQFTAGYSHPLPDLKGNFGEYYYQWTGNGNPDTNTFFMKSGINFGVLVKLPIKYKSNFNITTGITFNIFSNFIAYNDTSGNGDFDLTQSHVGISFGSEYVFQSKKRRFSPFIGFELSINFFGGKLKINGGSSEYTMNSTIRLGIAGGGGVDYAFHQNLGLILGAKYGFANIIGKSFNKDIGSKYNLNDGEHISDNGVKYPKKNITFLQFYGGLVFYFGK
ncbi:MAG: hypothetical protein N2510_06870 [Ignavibacteria bacterium]|nr:hypothetical protein [Ignavibacteria bacterium]